MSNPQPDKISSDSKVEDVTPAPLNEALADPEKIEHGKSEIYTLDGIDAALQRKLHLLNNAVDYIGWTNYQTTMSALCGFGIAADNMLVILQSVIASQAARELSPSYAKALTMAVYSGMLVGDIAWGLISDTIGRTFCFNHTLFIASAFAIVAGSAPSWVSLAFFISMAGFGAGGNTVVSLALLLEFLPSKYQYLMNFVNVWYALGQLVVGLFAWVFLANYSCPREALCLKANNWGWRYTCFTTGGVLLFMSIARVVLVQAKEPPKFLAGKNRDAEAIEVIRFLAAKKQLAAPISLEELQACGTVRTTSAKRAFSVATIWVHLKGLCSTKQATLQFFLLLASFMIMGLAFPLYNVFLPSYLMSRGAKLGDGSLDTTFRDYCITSACGVPGCLTAIYLSRMKYVGRRYTLFIGGVTTCAFLFAFTAVRTEVQNVALSCMINYCLYIYYGTLFVYASEVLPTAHRPTGAGFLLASGRVMSILSAVIATVADTTSSVPIYVCAAAFGIEGFIAVCFPFEPQGKRSL